MFRYFKAVIIAVLPKSESLSATWAFPLVVLSAFMIAWGAEVAQFLVSQGLALAMLAWLQTLPEFAVEAVIAWKAGHEPDKAHLMIANLTGSLRLLVGLGWPMIFGTATVFHRINHGRPLKEIILDDEHAVEVLALALPIIYWVFIWYKASLTVLDAGILFLLYLIYLVVLNRIPPQSEEKIEDMDIIPRTLLRSSKTIRNGGAILLFLGGGLILYFVAEPFLESMLLLAASLGISQFLFVQWVAPFLSEFPEKLSAFNWARRPNMAPMALMNMVSSNINQWTMLAAMLPVIYSISRGTVSPILFDSHQEAEILLTIAQSSLGILLLFNMRFAWYESLGIFLLWLIQFMIPATHRLITGIYLSWCLLEVVFLLVRRKQLNALFIFPRLLSKAGKK
ncbi:MAG: hypothetical protein HY232_05370 [Acidobacteria bacterium]|nr:hypothetical protein [Acidobacteriota bacterium]